MKHLVQILEALEELQASSSEPDESGICGYLLNAGCSLEGNTLYNIFERWPSFSGSFSYPVQGYNNLSARGAYLKGGCSWDKGSEYGRARWDLVDFLIKELRIYTGEVATKLREFTRVLQEGLTPLSKRGYTLYITRSEDSTEFRIEGTRYNYEFSVNHQEIVSVRKGVEALAQHHIEEAFLELNNMEGISEKNFLMFKKVLLNKLAILTKRDYTLKLEEVDHQCTKLTVSNKIHELIIVLHADMVLCGSQDPETIAASYEYRIILDINNMEERYYEKV